jgi:1-acyl-sn-glycerol-3-phosphate acyltransferase
MKKSKPLQFLARRYIRSRLRRSFADLRLEGCDSLQQHLQKGPLIMAANHVCWWDALLMLRLEEHLGCDAYCLMDAKNLQQFPYFGRLGAVSLERDQARAAYRDLRGAAALLDRPGRLLIIFPQGRQTPAHLPLDFHTGLSRLATWAAVPVAPVGIRYDFSEGPKAVVRLSAGKPQARDGRDARTFTESVREGVALELSHIDEMLLGQRPEAPSLMGRGKRDEKQGRTPLGGAALRLLMGRSSAEHRP